MAGPIPWTAVMAWADEHGFRAADAREDLRELVAELDAEWRRREAEACRASMQRR